MSLGEVRCDVKCWSSMRKWQRCTFFHSELIVFAQKQASSTTVKVRAGHGNEDAHSGNGVLL